MRERLAESGTVTERDTPLISFLWDIRMPICYKSPPPLLLSFSLPSSSPPSFRQSSHLLLILLQFLSEILSLRSCISFTQSFRHPFIHPFIHPSINLISQWSPPPLEHPPGFPTSEWSSHSCAAISRGALLITPLRLLTTLSEDGGGAGCNIEHRAVWSIDPLRGRGRWKE